MAVYSLQTASPSKGTIFFFHRIPNLPLFFLLIFLSSPCSSISSPSRDVTVEYFTDVSMSCDQVNVTLHPEHVTSLTWILPGGATVDTTSAGSVDSKKLTFSGPGANVAVTGADHPKLGVYNMTVHGVDDADFGWYTCVIVWNDGPVSIIRWGLNIDGADFSRLMEEYRENAIVGGVAAAAMLVLVGGACLIWNFRFANRHRDDGACIADGEMKANDNAAYRSEMEEATTEKSGIEMSNIDVAVVADRQAEAGYSEAS